MCDLCEGKKDYKGIDGGKLFMQETPNVSPKPNLYVWIGDERTVFDIKYCPLCGDKLIG